MEFNDFTQFDAAGKISNKTKSSDMEVSNNDHIGLTVANDEQGIVINNDWLSSHPVFYNQKSGKISDNINEVIDYDQFAFHPEGLRNYLEFGYSVFGQTPVKDVKFLPHSSKLTKSIDGSIQIEHQEDIANQYIGRRTHENDLLQKLKELIQRWEGSVDGDIIIPTSGGYDSRLLNFLVADKSRVRSFSYGVSSIQGQSTEVVFARKLSKILNTRWEQIELGNYHQYFKAWDRLFGPSTHAHGMYQIEFYKKMTSKAAVGSPLLSGIIGDAWAGSTKHVPINSADELSKIGYTHGMHADPNQLLLDPGNDLREAFWEAYRTQINDPVFQVVWLARFKIILLSYLLRIPEVFGYKPWSPFLIPEIALGMLTLSADRRKDRIWQKDFFQKHGLQMESMSLPADTGNTLNYSAIRKCPPKPLSSGLLREVIRIDYVDWINNRLSVFIKSRAFPKTLWQNDNGALKAYCAYLTLKPIENLLVRRNAFLKSCREHHATMPEPVCETTRKYNSSIEDESPYDEAYFKWQKRIGRFGGVANKFKFENHIKPNDTVVDFGCGGGYLLNNLICKRKIGIERNPVAITEAVSNRIETYPNADEIPDGIADVIISNHALEHVENPVEQLRMLKRKLSDDGIIVFVVPHEDITATYQEKDANYHLYTWNRQTLGNLFKHAGFHEIEIDLIRHQWPMHFEQVYQEVGEEGFHRICRDNAYKNNNYQIRISARKKVDRQTGPKIVNQTSCENNVPVALITYNRPIHTHKVLEALQSMGQKNLYIFSDGPKTQADVPLVESTRRLIRQIRWTKPFLVERNQNLGLARSIVSAVSRVFEDHDRLILLEDDCVPQTHFFNFMHTCLAKYEPIEKIYGISGHTVHLPDHLLERYPYDLYFSPRIGSWGWATWKRAWKDFEFDLEAAYQKAVRNRIDLNQGGTDIPANIQSMLNGNLRDVWTLNWVLTVYLNNGYYIFPTRSHVKNIGTDGSGVHCGTTEKYDTPIASSPSVRMPDQIVMEPMLMANFRKYFDIPNSVASPMQQFYQQAL